MARLLLLVASLLLGPVEAALVKAGPLTEHDPLAVCVSGAPSYYYWKPAAQGSAGERWWIVNLLSGDWCYSQESCAKRCPSGTGSKLCCSKMFPNEFAAMGLFYPKEEHLLDIPLKTANKVILPYCTSDAHMGDTSMWGRHFRGRRVVQALFKELVSKRGLGRGGGRDILIFGGQSAGARGAMVHLDYVKEMMGTKAADNVDVVGFLDSPLWLESEMAPGCGNVPLEEQTRSIFRNLNTGHHGRFCEAKHQGEERWRCLFGEHRLEHVETPFFLIASDFDKFQLGRNRCGKPDKDYMARFSRKTREVVQRLGRGGNGAVVHSCYDHAESLTSHFNGVRVQGASINMAFALFLSQQHFVAASPLSLAAVANITAEVAEEDVDMNTEEDEEVAHLQTTVARPACRGECPAEDDETSALQARATKVVRGRKEGPVSLCGSCAAFGKKADGCNCGRCGSFGGCSWSCSEKGGGPRCSSHEGPLLWIDQCQELGCNPTCTDGKR